MGLVNEFLRTDILSGSTINYVRPPLLGPLTFPVAMLVAGTAVFVLVFLFSRRAKARPATGALIYTFAITSLLFTLRMDLNWLAMLADDLRDFRGADISKRFEAIDGNDLYRFTEFVKKSLPPGEKLRELSMDQSAPGYYPYRLGSYYLLPVLSSKTGRFVWVHGALDASYDARTMTLKVNSDAFIARPYAVYSPNAGIFEITGEGP